MNLIPRKFNEKPKFRDGRRIYLEFQTIITGKRDTTNFQHLVWYTGNTI